jgi:hypothetical protein
MGSPRGEHKARGTRRTWRQLETRMKKVSMIAEKGGEDNTAEATRVVHVHVRTNKLKELMA